MNHFIPTNLNHWEDYSSQEKKPGYMLLFGNFQFGSEDGYYHRNYCIDAIIDEHRTWQVSCEIANFPEGVILNRLVWEDPAFRGFDSFEAAKAAWPQVRKRIEGQMETIFRLLLS